VRLEVTQDAARGRVGEADLLDEEQVAHGPPDSAAVRRTDRDGSNARRSGSRALEGHGSERSCGWGSGDSCSRDCERASARERVLTLVCFGQSRRREAEQAADQSPAPGPEEGDARGLRRGHGQQSQPRPATVGEEGQSESTHRNAQRCSDREPLAV